MGQSMTWARMLMKKVKGSRAELGRSEVKAFADPRLQVTRSCHLLLRFLSGWTARRRLHCSSSRPQGYLDGSTLESGKLPTTKMMRCACWVILEQRAAKKTMMMAMMMTKRVEEGEKEESGSETQRNGEEEEAWRQECSGGCARQFQWLGRNDGQKDDLGLRALRSGR